MDDLLISTVSERLTLQIIQKHTNMVLFSLHRCGCLKRVSWRNYISFMAKARKRLHYWWGFILHRKCWNDSLKADSVLPLFLWETHLSSLLWHTADEQLNTEIFVSLKTIRCSSWPGHDNEIKIMIVQRKKCFCFSVVCYSATDRYKL